MKFKSSFYKSQELKKMSNKNKRTHTVAKLVNFPVMTVFHLAMLPKSGLVGAEDHYYLIEFFPFCDPKP